MTANPPSFLSFPPGIAPSFINIQNNSEKDDLVNIQTNQRGLFADWYRCVLVWTEVFLVFTGNPRLIKVHEMNESLIIL